MELVFSFASIFNRFRYGWLLRKEKPKLEALSKNLRFTYYASEDKADDVHVDTARLQSSLQLAYRKVDFVSRFLESNDWQCGVFDTQADDEGLAGRFTVFMKTLRYSSPHIYFDYKKNNSLLKRDIPVKLKNAKLIQYEAFVSDRFKLFAPKGYTLDSLVVAAPDVLDILSRFNNNADIEILGNQLFFIYPKQINLADNIENLIKASAVLADSLNDNLSRYRDERSPGAMQSIGYKGQRLTDY